MTKMISDVVVPSPVRLQEKRERGFTIGQLYDREVKAAGTGL
ncbi:hypothetical protein [Sinomicrobium pectinilyticum]|nr:hypothetical protein [Sinomicrobium pectinilyticum]